MDAQRLKDMQAPLKQQYRDRPDSAVITLKASGALGEGITCRVETGKALVEAGLHPATGGNGLSACSGDMLLGLALRGGSVRAEGDLDFRGTLGVAKEAPVGFREIRLAFDLDIDASEEQLATLLKLTERYCVVYQTLRNSPKSAVTMKKAA